MNSESGVPLGMLGLRMSEYGASSWLSVVCKAPLRAFFGSTNYDVYVAEYGVDHPGDMENLLSIRVPDIAVVTSVALEHADYFPKGTMDEVLGFVADEEMKLVAALPEKATAIVFGDDVRITERLPNVRAQVITVGTTDKSACEVLHYHTASNETVADIFINNFSYPARFAFPVTRASVTSVALATVAANVAGVPVKEALGAIAGSWEVPAGRGRVLHGQGGHVVIDSSYNATPTAVADALVFLNDIADQRRRVAILGDMRELGVHTAEAHQALAPMVSANADLVLLVGPAMGEYLKPLLGSPVDVHAYKTVTELFAELDGLLKTGDVILVKGSQNTLFLERVTEHLLADKEDADLLPRRGERWDAARASVA
jgi:UDP-N-acetylmuramyl pentapeptide synthase